jgi:hypothetical protein
VSFLARSFADRARQHNAAVANLPSAIAVVAFLTARRRRWVDLLSHLNNRTRRLAGHVSGYAVVIGQRGHASNQHDNEADKESHSTPRSQLSGIAVGLNPLYPA